MIRGTTPTLEFEIPFETEIISEAFVTLSQKEKVVLDKHLSECMCEGNKLSVSLTQEETLQLDCRCVTEIQLRVRLKDGNALASQIIPVITERILKDGVV